MYSFVVAKGFVLLAPISFWPDKYNNICIFDVYLFFKHMDYNYNQIWENAMSTADALLSACELKCAYEFTAQEVAPVLVRICFPFSTEIEFLIISSLIKFM